MVDEKDATQRRVYVLPTTLVTRIETFQKQRKIASEVEAVRQLLDEALKNRETPSDLAYQIYYALIQKSQTIDVLKDLVIGHPVVESIKKEPDEWVVECKGGIKYSFGDDRTLYEHDRKTNVWHEYVPF